MATDFKNFLNVVLPCRYATILTALEFPGITFADDATPNGLERVPSRGARAVVGALAPKRESFHPGLCTTRS